MTSIFLRILLFHLAFQVFGCEMGETKSEKQAIATDKAMQRIGGPCETCELMYEKMPQVMDATDTSAGWQEDGTRLQVKGKMVKSDGSTPAAGVIIYYWQTDNSGRYTPNDNMEGGSTLHGHIRGWLKPDATGQFTIWTIRPGAYPNSDIEAHIHVLVKEPGLPNEYYIDDWVFDNDPLLTHAKRKARENRGGNGIQQVSSTYGLETIEPLIILGKNIPGYPAGR